MSKVTNPYVTRNEAGDLITTNAGYRHLSKIVTDVRGPVYAFTNNADPLKVAAAMARLSRRGDDLRKIYLDEFANYNKFTDTFLDRWAEKAYNFVKSANSDRMKDLALFKRVVTGFGDDSVAQLNFIYLAYEGASNLLTKLIEWGRLRAYLEQSTRYIYFDQMDINGRYNFFTPKNLSPSLLNEYERTMAHIFDLYSDIVHELTGYERKKNPEPEGKLERVAWIGATRAQACDAARPLLPVAVKSTVGIVGSAQSIQNMILFLSAHNLLEAQEAGISFLRESRKVSAAFLERTDMPEYGGAAVAYQKDIKESMKKISEELLLRRSSESPRVVLLDYWPKNELDIVPEMLFESSRVPIIEIENTTARLSYEEKLKIFNTYVGNRLNRRQKPGRAFEKIHYEWIIFADYGTFRDLQRHRMVDMMEWQELTTKYGFDVPKSVVDSGLEQKFRLCFLLSDELYNKMASEKHEEEAQYATLLGHKMRYRFMLNARAAFHFHELRTGPQGHPGYRSIVNEMHDILKKVHPNIAAAMKFVNQGEDPALTRMAAEMATQRKLMLLSKE